MASIDAPPGALVMFATLPHNKHSPPVTGRFAAFKVLSHDEKERMTLVAVLDYIETQPPTAETLSRLGVMERQDAFGAKKPFYIHIDDRISSRQQEPEFQIIGQSEVTPEEAALEIYSHTGRWAISNLVETIWRSEHDAEAFEAERVLLRAEGKARQDALEKRKNERLRGLTLETLMQETQFSAWEPVDDLMPKAVLDALQNRAKALIEDAIALGPKPRRADIRKLMRAFVDWVNEVNATTDPHPIETMEREDICAFLEEIAWATNQRPLMSEIDDWRDW